jgi:hypothetical protein
MSLEETSVSPNPHPINLHLLWKDRAAVRTADEITANRDVENDKELALKLGRAIHSARDIALEVLDPIDLTPLP